MSPIVFHDPCCAEEIASFERASCLLHRFPVFASANHIFSVVKTISGGAALWHPHPFTCYFVSKPSIPNATLIRSKCTRATLIGKFSPNFAQQGRQPVSEVRDRT
jgi:hypothetical protein